ncbi:hypothetical protein F2Q68_00029698 [Brassica cretica]|uniref:Uncharacterized protein n=1 Tax=Brassica cretica TaxID=69181 RepID=A0A8S9G4R9_BRACR|nr:hypothetical protein F2Q68_00029698 [Brassica cretica]
MVVRGEGWNKWARELDSPDDENDDAPIPGDMRDVLKRKLEPEDDNSSENTDLRLTLNARKFQRISTNGHVLKEHPKCPIGDLRDKLNACMCDLRVLLSRSKPTGSPETVGTN